MGVSPAAVSGNDPGHHGFHPLSIRRVIPETTDAVSLVLDVPADLAPAFAYRAGQFLTFRLAIGERRVLRSYSMSSSPEVDDELQVTVKRVAGGLVSNWIADALAAGDTLESTRPAGVFCLGERTGDIVAFAGGSGITPVYSLLKTALETTSRRVRLLYANRDREGAIFAKELDALAARHPDRLTITHHFDVAGGFIEADAIRGHVAAAASAPPVRSSSVGLGRSWTSSSRPCTSDGIAPECVHIERFTPADALPEPEPTASQTAATVEIELDGKVQTTDHRPGTTILQTARQMGLTPPSSCEAGDCATCMGRLLEGSVTMRNNNALTAEEVDEGWILTCQAVPDSPSVRVIYGYD